MCGSWWWWWRWLSLLWWVVVVVVAAALAVACRCWCCSCWCCWLVLLVGVAGVGLVASTPSSLLQWLGCSRWFVGCLRSCSHGGLCFAPFGQLKSTILNRFFTDRQSNQVTENWLTHLSRLIGVKNQCSRTDLQHQTLQTHQPFCPLRTFPPAKKHTKQQSLFPPNQDEAITGGNIQVDNLRFFVQGS